MKIVDRYNGKLIAKQDQFDPKTRKPIAPNFWVLDDDKPTMEQLANTALQPVRTLAEARKLIGKVIADTQDLATKTKGKAAYAAYYQKRVSK